MNMSVRLTFTELEKSELKSRKSSNFKLEPFQFRR